jgi:hypothetical protein
MISKEASMIARVGFYCALAVAIVALGCSGCSGCFGSSLEGTYRNANGMATLELRSGGSAALSVMGENHACTYKKDGAKLLLTCPGQDVMTITIHDDGSLTADGTFVGAMTKAK